MTKQEYLALYLRGRATMRRIGIALAMLAACSATPAAGQSAYDDGSEAVERGDHAAAAFHFRRSCDEGGAARCTCLGYLHDEGLGITQDYPRAAAFYRRGCDGGDLTGCYNLGVILEGGLGVAKDE